MANEASPAIEAIPDSMATSISETQLTGGEEGPSQTTFESTFSASRGLFVRPSSAGDDPAQQFKFGMAQKQQLNFTGNRKGPAAAQVSFASSKPNVEAAHPPVNASPPEELSIEQELGDPVHDDQVAMPQ